MSQNQNQPLPSGDGTAFVPASFFLHAHSHPHNQSRSPSATSSAANSLRIRASSEPSTQHLRQQQYSPQTHQQRRLLLRNAGFPGVIFPAKDTAWTPMNSSKTNYQSGYEDDEETPRPPRKIRRNAEETIGNPLGILEEISNSSIRRKSSWATEFGPILQDQNNTSGFDDTERSLSSAENSENISPQRSEATLKSDRMRSQGGTLNPQTPSPIAKGKTRAKRISRLRSKSFESARYIEHLESQLAALQAQLQSLTSPTTTKTQSAKLRALTAESRVLRQEVQEWENKFNERVKEELDARAEVESGLRTKIRQLERELEINEGRAAALQREVERLERTAKEADVVQAENVNLERRLDVLTGILAQSPTKIISSSELAASMTNGEGRKKPRPRSMIPRIIHSGGTQAAPLPMPKATHSREDSVLSTSTESASSQSQLGDDYQDLLHHYSSKRNRASADLESIFSHAPSVSSAPSTQGSISRPMSMVSDNSASHAGWELPMPTLTTPRSSRSYANRPRRMRRFPSGSSAPKTLILPTTSNTLSLPVSAPLDCASGLTYEPVRSRDSISAGLPSASGGLSFDTPRQHSRNSSAASAWAERETLKALEANSAFSKSSPATSQTPEISSSPSLRSCYQRREASFTCEETPCPEGESLFVEISRVEESGLCESPAVVETSQPHLYNYVTRDQQQNTTPGHSPKGQALTTKPPITTLAGHLGNFFARFSAILAELCHHPSRLARRLLAAAWWSSSTTSESTPKATKELGWWWVLGLLLRPLGGGQLAARKEKKKDEEAPPPTANGKRAPGFDWHEYTPEASKSRLFAHYQRNVKNITSATVPEETEAEITAEAEADTHSQTPKIYPLSVSPAEKIYLWFKFAVALALAVGVAIRDGPDLGDERQRPMLHLLPPPSDYKCSLKVKKGFVAERERPP